MSCIRKVALIINCAYARASIHENSQVGLKGRNARQAIDILERKNNFTSQFGTYTEYAIPDGYFEVGSKDRKSQFDRDCNKILDTFIKFRRDINFPKQSYLSLFSVSQWLKLPESEKKKHTLGNCTRCFELHKDHQSAFPLKPFYQAEPVVILDQDALHRQGVKKFTTNVLSELNRVYTKVPVRCRPIAALNFDL